MTILSKSTVTTIIPGKPGVNAVPAVPSKAGYYRSIQVPYTGVVQPVQRLPYRPPVTPLQITIPTFDSFDVRAASYGEIVSFLWGGSRSDLCGIRAMIMEVVYNTEFQFTILKKLGTLSILTVAYVPELKSTGIARATKTVSQSWPTDRRNAAYDVMHPKDKPHEPIWRFDDYYTCRVEFNREVVEEI